MANIKKFDIAPISFDKEGEVAQLQYGGYPYAMDFSLSVVAPSRMSISFITALEGKDKWERDVAGDYDWEALENDIDAGTCQDAQSIFYCGKRFIGYPLKYSIRRAPSGDILTVDYYDSSIAVLDNRFVLLAGEDVPDFKAEEDVNVDSAAESWKAYEFLSSNPCPEHMFILGEKYQKNATGAPLVGGAKSCNTSQSESDFEVLYTNYELAQALKDCDAVNISEASLRILAPGFGDDDPDVEKVVFLERYHGILRDVLRQWGDRMGFSFYWDTSKMEEGDDGNMIYANSGELVLFNLKDGLTYESIKDVIKKTVNACNLLEKTEGYSKEDTFNKAISASYTKSGLFDETQRENFVYLDMYTMPIFACHTDEGLDKYKDPAVWPSRIGSNVLRTNYPDWYKLWDSPNYFEVKDDKQIRQWMTYQPRRPNNVMDPDINDECTAEFRDYIRLVKAAALGEKFFRAYIFFKGMANTAAWGLTSTSTNNVFCTLGDYMEMLAMTRNLTGALQDPSNASTYPRMDEIKKSLLENDLTLLMPDKITEVTPQKWDELVGQVATENIEGDSGQTTQVPKADNPKLKELIIKGGFLSDTQMLGGPAGSTPSRFIPVVANKALFDIMNSAYGDIDWTTGRDNVGSYPGGDDIGLGGGNPPGGNDAGAANIKICDGIVLGKDCLTVKALSPAYEATAQLYKLILGKTVGGCQDENHIKDINAVTSETRVTRLASNLMANAKTARGTAGPNKDNTGTPYFFAAVNRFGNSMLTDSATQNHMYKQLRTVAEMGGRYHFYAGTMTENQFSKRDFKNVNAQWEPLIVDVADGPWGDSFAAFDPMAGEAAKPMPNEFYTALGGELNDRLYGLFDKNRESNQKQLNDWDGTTPPSTTEADACERNRGKEFETPPNSARPNNLQWVEYLFQTTLVHSLANSDQLSTTFPGGARVNSDGTWMPGKDQLQTAKMTKVELEKVSDETGDYYTLKKRYTAANGDISPMGRGYCESCDVIEEIRTNDPTWSEPINRRTVLGPRGAIEELIFDDVGRFDLVNEEPPKVYIVFKEPVDCTMIDGLTATAQRTQLDVCIDDESMNIMDSIRESNYNTLQKQRSDSCCCPDTEKGIVYIEKDSLDVQLPVNLQKQVARISDATNIPLESRISSTYVTHAAYRNVDVSFSTNLIPVELLNPDGKAEDGPAPSAVDELDWIVDQVVLPGTFEANNFIVPANGDEDNPLTVGRHVKQVNYTTKGADFAVQGLGIPISRDSVAMANTEYNDNKMASPEDVDGIAEEDLVKVNNEIEGCNGFTGRTDDYKNCMGARTMAIDFLKATDEDLKIVIEEDCLEALSEKKRQEVMAKIREKLADFIRQRAYSQNTPSAQCTVSIADCQLIELGEDGEEKPIQFGGDDGTNLSEGIPSIEQGLENLSIRVDGGGLKVTIGLGTKRKLRTLSPSNVDQWELMNPRQANLTSAPDAN